MQTQFTELTDSQWEIIEKYISHHKPRKHNLRTIVNAILWVCRVGGQWRNLDSQYPKWESVYYYFYIWSRSGIWEELLSELVSLERQREGRAAIPSAVAIDSQSIKAGPFISGATIGIDGGKKIKGRKRHLIVDTLGLPLVIEVTPADTHDGVAGVEMLWQLEKRAPDVKLIRTDGTYGGYFKETAEQIYRWEVETNQKRPSQEGFVPQEGRWPVERSFAWTNSFRRMAKDFEKTFQSAKAFLQITFVAVILNRLPAQ